MKSLCYLPFELNSQKNGSGVSKKGKVGLWRFYLREEERKKKRVCFEKREHSERLSQVLLRFSQEIYIDDDRVHRDFNNKDGYDIEIENQVCSKSK